MGLIWGSPKLLLSLGLGLFVLGGSLGGCSRRAAVAPPESADQAEVAAAGAAATPAELVGDGTFRSTPIDPVRVGRLTTQAAGAQINLRSQPTTQSAAQGYGNGGDQITLLHLAEGEGGFSWYYVKFDQSGAEGWVRGDFVDASSQAVAPAPAPAATLAPGATPGGGAAPCGDGNRPEAFFETKSFTVHLCQTPRGLSYIGLNRGSHDTLATTDVSLNQGTYIAIDGNRQYHINDKTLSVYQVTSGSYTQLKGEDVVRHERFLY
ncbi:MAG: SH3 domain-containing protein [Leptolyngbya sp. DLM2.Bin27]|nr:MAG: SH3 domain-containing protein [Leptolyngbya sp. DLM2.Bin27]